MKELLSAFRDPFLAACFAMSAILVPLGLTYLESCTKEDVIECNCTYSEYALVEKDGCLEVQLVTEYDLLAPCSSHNEGGYINDGWYQIDCK